MQKSWNLCIHRDAMDLPRAFQELERSLKFYNKAIGCSLTIYIDKTFFSLINFSNARGYTPGNLLLGKT